VGLNGRCAILNDDVNVEANGTQGRSENEIDVLPDVCRPEVDQFGGRCAGSRRVIDRSVRFAIIWGQVIKGYPVVSGVDLEKS
jgi:hypothetical protein